MKVAFVVNRLSDNKWYAPLIVEALKRGYKVECWICARDISQTTKWYDFASDDKLPTFYQDVTVRKYLSAEEIAGLATDFGAGNVISITDLPPEARPKNQIWSHISSAFIDSFASFTPDQLSQYDNIFIGTQHWADMALSYYATRKLLKSGSSEEALLKSKFRALGAVQYDSFFLCDKATIRTELGIPLSATVITVYVFEVSTSFWSQRIFSEPSVSKRLLSLATLPFSYPFFVTRRGLNKILSASLRSLWERLFFLKAVLTDPSELEVLEALKKYCLNNGYFLLFKYRKKNPLRPFQLGLADLAINEDSDFYPYTSAQIISASDQIVTFYSSGAAEAIFAKVPSLNICPENDSYFSKDKHAFFYGGDSRLRENAERNIFFNKEPGVFNFPGAVSSMTVKEAVNKLPQSKLEDMNLNSASAESYVRKFINPRGISATAGEILDYLNEPEKKI